MIPRYTHPEMGRVWSEENKLQKWLLVEVLVCEAWARLGVVPQEALDEIRRASVDRERMAAIEAETHHDVISFVRSLAEQVGDAGRFIHLGLTSSDVLDTALAVQLLEAADILLADLARLEEVLARQAVRHKDTLMIGRTHGIHAEPTTFGFKLAGWVAETRRNRRRLQQARETVDVGKIGGAVGTHANVPPDVEEYVCAKLGLRPDEVGTQVISRDRHAEFLATLGVVAASVEKMALELRHLQRTEVGEVFEPFGERQQGSSAMPHKRNPELCERLCGLARVVRSHVVPALENVALWHERDISHSSVERIVLPDACIALDYMLRTLTRVVDGMEVDAARMRRNLEATRGLVYSGRVLLALVERGMPRSEAYELVQSHAKRLWFDDRGHLRELLREDERVARLLTEEELAERFDPGYHLRHVDGGFRRLGPL